MQEFLQASPKEASHYEDQKSTDQMLQQEEQNEEFQSLDVQPPRAGTIVKNFKRSQANQPQKQPFQLDIQIEESQTKIGKYKQKIEQQFDILQELLTRERLIEQKENKQKERGDQMQQEILQYALDQQQHDLVTEETTQAKSCLKVYKLSSDGKPILQNLYLDNQKKLDKVQSPKSEGLQKNILDFTQEKDDYLLDELQYLLQENNQIQQELQQVDLKMNELRQNVLTKSITNFQSEQEQQI